MIKINLLAKMLDDHIESINSAENFYLKLGFKVIKDGCWDKASYSTSINAKNSDYVSVGWGL
jgi:hypothetical protein